MTSTIEKQKATAQLDRAIAALRDALKNAQEIAPIGNTDSPSEKTISALTETLQHVSALKTEDLTSPKSRGHIRSSMPRLKSVMALLQAASSSSPAEQDTLRLIARTLALLYPVSTLIEQLADRETPPRRSSIPAPYPDAEYRERRSTLRRLVELDIGLHADTNFFTGFSADVSSGGLFVSTYDVLPIGTRINVNFSLPAGPILSVNGVVRWVREFNEMSPEVMPGMGIQFEGLSAEEAELISRYMSDIPPMFYA